jgi:hypothetical protein
MGWPNLLSKQGSGDVDGVDNLVLLVTSPRLIPDANAIARNPMDIHDFKHLCSIAIDHKMVEL